MLSQFAGVRLMTLGDGVERGIRMLEFRTGSGLRFTALVDRALDIADCDYQGAGDRLALAGGFRHPGLHEYEGENGLAWARSFSGLLVTCGLDHILGPEEVPADNYNYPGKTNIRHSLHGRVGTIPARLTGYGETWDGDRCVLWAEGIVQQSAVFGEDLHLIRRIEADVGGNEIRITRPRGQPRLLRTPHMFFYHVNVGHPLLDEGSRYVAPIRDVVWAAHAGEDYRAQGVGYRTASAPQADFASRSGSTRLAPTATARCRWPWSTTGSGFGLEVVTRKEQLPCAYQWQNFQAGQYALGDRAVDAPCAWRSCRPRARRDDLAGAWRGAPLRCAACAFWTARRRSRRRDSASGRSPRSPKTIIPRRPGCSPPSEEGRANELEGGAIGVRRGRKTVWGTRRDRAETQDVENDDDSARQ